MSVGLDRQRLVLLRRPSILGRVARMRRSLKFLVRARKLFQALAPEPETPVQYFNVLCASGHRVRGERTEGYQALRCPACGEGVFVLPRSPLPEPVAPERPSTPKAVGM